MPDLPEETPCHPSPIPLLEYDPSRDAVIEPGRVIRRNPSMPEAVVLCFMNTVLKKAAQQGAWPVLGHLVCESDRYPVFQAESDGQRVAVVHPGIGAALSAGLFEELIAMGGRRFIACGGAGVLERGVAVGKLIVVDSAVRDEGTSFHYLPPSREVKASAVMVDRIEKILTRKKVPFLRAKSWTTDAYFRETPLRVAGRKAEGCLVVEMEAAAILAVAEFRGVEAGFLLYAGDDLSGPEWDSRDWQQRHDVRERHLELAIAIAAVS